MDMVIDYCTINILNSLLKIMTNCPCGNPISPKSKQCKSCSNRNREFKWSEKAKLNAIGKHNWTNSMKAKMREAKNPNWKGDRVGYNALHEWIKSRFPKTELCENGVCMNPPYDLANKSNNYLREISDWEWLCRKCHMLKDNRINNLKQYAN